MALLILVLMLFCSTVAGAQQRDKYEFMRNLPVYADSLIADLNYPYAYPTATTSKGL